MDIKEARDNLLAVLDGIDKNKLSLPDLKIYADTLKTVSEIQTKSYQEYLADTMSNFCCATPFKAATVSELKGGAADGV